MKFFVLTERFGGRATASILGWGNTVYFAGEPPPLDRLLLVELPGLTAMTYDAVVAWLRARRTGGGLDELPRETWRLAVIDDVLVAANYGHFVWQFSRLFPTSEFVRFADVHWPPLRADLRSALAWPDPAERVERLAALQDRATRIGYLSYALPNRMNQDVIELRRTVDRARLAALRALPFDRARWIATAREMTSPDEQAEVWSELAREAAAGGPESVDALLGALLTAGLELRTHTPALWTPLAPALALSPTVHGETIDLASATEVTVPLGWMPWRARRVGPVAIGRPALLIGDPDPAKVVLVRGARELKFKVAKAGGRLTKFGCTLVLGDQRNALQRRLLEVDRLDTLANVDPLQALSSAEALGVSIDATLAEAARAAQTDPRHARVLADLLIDAVLGLDADVARRIVRRHARGNRR